MNRIIVRVWVVVYNLTEVQIDNSKHVDNLEECFKNMQNSPDVDTLETAGQASYLSGS